MREANARIMKVMGRGKDVMNAFRKNGKTLRVKEIMEMAHWMNDCLKREDISNLKQGTTLCVNLGTLFLSKSKKSYRLGRGIRIRI